MTGEQETYLTGEDDKEGIFMQSRLTNNYYACLCKIINMLRKHKAFMV